MCRVYHVNPINCITDQCHCLYFCVNCRHAFGNGLCPRDGGNVTGHLNVYWWKTNYI